MENDGDKQRTNSTVGEQVVSNTSLGSNVAKKDDAASGNDQTEISTDTDFQSQNSRNGNMSESSCNPGMQKHELFFLLLLNSTLLYLKGGSDC